MNALRNTIVSVAASVLAATIAHAQTAPLAEAKANPDRMVRTLSAGDIPMLDDVSLTLLAGGTPEQALQLQKDEKYVDKGFWSQSTAMGNASIRRYMKMGLPEMQARAELVRKSTKFFIPVAQSEAYLNAGGASFPLSIDGERFNMTPTNASVCTFGRKSCLLIDNVNINQAAHRQSKTWPGTLLKERTTMLDRAALPMYGLIVDIKPGAAVQQIDGHAVVAANAERAGYIDLTQCDNSTACGVSVEFNFDGTGATGLTK